MKVKVVIEVINGSKQSIDKNISALERAIEGRIRLVCDSNYLIDTLSILKGIRANLPNKERR